MNARGAVVTPKSVRAAAITNSRTTTRAAKSNPSSVASNGPTWKSKVAPGRVKTETNPTAIVSGAVATIDVRSTLRTTRPATAPGSTSTTNRPIGAR